MAELETLYVVDAREWRRWLERNFRRTAEVWLIYPKKATGRPRIEYNAAVEEALCFGWIDSTVKSLDDDHTAQRFTPRRAGSEYSQANKERLRWLLRNEKVHPSVESEAARVVAEPFEFPEDVIRRIRADTAAWNNYLELPEPYKRIRIAYIVSARKRPEEFEKRMSNFLDHTRKKKLIKGFGGIEKYYHRLYPRE